MELVVVALVAVVVVGALAAVVLTARRGPDPAALQSAEAVAEDT